MDHIRIKASIHLNRHHALTEKDLEALKPSLERAMAGALPIDQSRYRDDYGHQRSEPTRRKTLKWE